MVDSAAFLNGKHKLTSRLVPQTQQNQETHFVFTFIN